MKLLVFFALASIAAARPDVGLGYNYQPPATSYGVPAGSIGGVNDRQYYHVSQNTHRETFAPIATPSRSFETPIREHSSFNGASSSGPSIIGISGSAPTGIGSGSSVTGQSISGISSFPRFQGTSGQSVVSGVSGPSVSGSSSFSSSSLTGAPVQQQNTKYTASRGSFGFSGGAQEIDHRGEQIEVQKHLYFFTAPEEPEEIQSRINIPAAPVQKNVKILFIKAPTYRAPSIQIPLQQQNEEKTVVYVLVKKPEEQSNIELPSRFNVKPSKPEVYFIKYKSQKEAEEAISRVQSGAASGGASVIANTVEGDQAFINTIRQDASSSNQGISFANFPEGPSEDSVTTNTRGSFDFTLGGNLPASEVRGTEGSINTGIHSTETHDGGIQGIYSGVQSSGIHGSGVQTVDVGQSKQSVFGSSTVAPIAHTSAASLNFGLNGNFGSSTSVPSIIDGNRFGGSTTANSLDNFSYSQNTIPKVHQTYGPPN